ncbi:MAG: helix-turn-helix transcriptional regulator [Acidobacteriia bacterium]|nr:helix-turn-helix transcriptional regulator [Terriglobia bacterium]
MSQIAAAKAVGTSQSAVARIESAQENITMDTLRRFVVALKGRFHVSIPPQECVTGSMRSWWEMGEPSTSWHLSDYAVSDDAKHLLLLMGRQPETTLTQGTGTLLLLQDSKTEASYGNQNTR